jgi:CBS domain containing-hemolysin-like protein
MSIVVKKTIGSVFFQYIEEYPNENDALQKINGTFKTVELNKLRLERVKITKKENDDNKSEDSTKTEGQRTEKV